jgi:hypothetical protein
LSGQSSLLITFRAGASRWRRCSRLARNGQAFEEHDVGFVFEERAGEGWDEFAWVALFERFRIDVVGEQKL